MTTEVVYYGSGNGGGGSGGGGGGGGSSSSSSSSSSSNSNSSGWKEQCRNEWVRLLGNSHYPVRANDVLARRIGRRIAVDRCRHQALLRP
jgi:hypothetical protein